MVVDRVLVSALGPDRRAALLAADGGLVDYRLSRRPGDLLAGDLFLARARRLARDFDAVFVDLGGGAHGLVMREDLAERRWPAEGEPLALRVLRAPEGDKVAKLTARLAAEDARLARAARGQGRSGLIRPAPDPIVAALAEAGGPALRFVAVDDADLLVALRARRPEIADRLVLHNEAGDLFARHGVDAALAQALSPTVPLPSGGRLLIHETPALVAVDVDSGGAQGGGGERTARLVNGEAVEAVVWAARARRLGGSLVVDLLPMRDRRLRAEILERLTRAAARDPAITGVDHAGGRRLLVRLTRARPGPSLRQLLSEPCPACGGSGHVRRADLALGEALRAVVAATRGDPARPARLAVSAALLAALRGPAKAVHEAAVAKLGWPIDIILDATLPADGYGILQG